ncbi:MAG: PDZ domain-containing protein, partial [Elusimicrobia bacterium]|nr:PDZ domain-containing protein [Elusimicrobiota bacterium]
VAPGSTLRARVVDAADDGETRTVRLGFYALDLAGGGTYPTLGAATAVSGDQTARVSSGGTVIAPAPLPKAKRREAGLILDADARLHVSLLEPLTLDEPPSFWRAGPGFWIKSAEAGGRRVFEISHLVPERSAAASGLKIGDHLAAIGGRSCDAMDFAEAIDRLYGAPGSDVSVTVLRAGSNHTLSLKRGARASAGRSTALPLPYEAR